MTQYKTQYGTIFAVKEHNGAPAIMCRAEHSETWSLSSMITPFTPGAWTTEELQGQLDSWAATKGWQPVAEPASAEPPLPMPGDVYQAPQSGQLYKIGELTNGKKTCYLTMRCNVQDGTWVPANSSVYPNLSDAQGEFEAWIRREQLEPVAQTMDAAVITDERAAVSTEETTTTLASGAGAKNCPADASTVPQPEGVCADIATTVPSSLPTFDYGGLDADTAEHLQNLAQRATEAKQRYILDMMEIVVEAHRELCDTVVQPLDNGRFSTKENTFTAWCASIGVGRSTAYNLLQVQALMDGSTPEEQAVLADAPAKLLYAAAKPSAPPELVQAVKDRDITTAKEFRELEAQLKAERAAREKAEKDAKAMKDGYSVAKKNEEFTLKNLKAAERERDEALKQRDGARDALQAAKLRGDKLKAENEALKAQPVEAQVVDEEEVNRRAQARADELTAPLREELEALRARHPTDLEEAEQAIRDAYDSAIYTGRVMENAWHTLRPLLPRMDAHRRELAIQQVSKTLAQIQGEIAACL